MSDTNLNTMYQQQDKYDTEGLKNLWVNFMDNNNFVVHNSEPTHFEAQTTPSCIDHIWSNCSSRVFNVETCQHFISYDHHLVKASLRIKINNMGSTYSKFRDWSILTKNELQLAISLNPSLTEVFSPE